MFGWMNYYVPLLWTITTRYPSIMNKISFFIIDMYPGMFITICLSNTYKLDMCFYYLLAFYMTFCFYEIGYIFNETIAVRYEECPTIRLSGRYWNEILKHVQNLVTLRLILGCMIYIFFIYNIDANITFTGYLIAVLLIVYTIHNYILGRLKILTMGLEVLLKYAIPMSVFLRGYELLYAVNVCFFAIVLLRMIEYISKKKYIAGINVIDDVDLFRIKYYLWVFFASAICFLVFGESVCSIWLYGSFLVYRIICFWIMRKSKLSQKIIDNRKKHHTA